MKFGDQSSIHCWLDMTTIVGLFTFHNKNLNNLLKLIQILFLSQGSCLISTSKIWKTHWSEAKVEIYIKSSN